MSELLSRAANDADFNEALMAALLSFECAQDNDIEDFLRRKAIDFERKKLCRVYLMLNEDDFDNGKLTVEAYFTLSQKSIVTQGSEISKTKVQKISGGCKDAESLDFVLIGQLGKYIGVSNGTEKRSTLSGSEILDEAFSVIRQIDALIPCKYVIVECSDDPNVQKIYTDYKFSFLQNDGTHNQYYRLLDK